MPDAEYVKAQVISLHSKLASFAQYA